MVEGIRILLVFRPVARQILLVSALVCLVPRPHPAAGPLVEGIRIPLVLLVELQIPLVSGLVFPEEHQIPLVSGLVCLVPPLGIPVLEGNRTPLVFHLVFRIPVIREVLMGVPFPRRLVLVLV